ncbi:hypothetical protein HZC32_01345 [Candidatus Woesearchaeota archaeon]|nr:hypothetical protein [Candidatus Woesearchaeota archaeon]
MTPKDSLTVINLLAAVVIFMLAASSVIYFLAKSDASLSGAAVASESMSISKGVFTPVQEYVKDVFSPAKLATTLAFLSLAVLLLLVIVSIFLFATPSSRLRKKLKKLTSVTEEESIEVLKGEYTKIYNAYLGLSEKKKQNFYALVNNLREQIEEILRAEKKVEELVEKTARCSIEEQKALYPELYNHFLKLPAKTRDKYYPSIVHLKERLERGTT